MDFSIPGEIAEDLGRFKTFLGKELTPRLSGWYQQNEAPRDFYEAMGREGWFGFQWKNGRMFRRPALREALLTEELATLSPGVAVAALAHLDLGVMGLWLFGSDQLKERYGEDAIHGKIMMCIGSTESTAGSDVANISMQARKVDDGWLLDGVKAYVTNGYIADMAVITAVSDPDASRSRRLSMFLVGLGAGGVSRKKLNKRVWIPSDLTRVQFKNVFVPDDHLLGERGRGIQQVLTIFTNSRVPISALTLGTARGAFELALDHAKKRKIFGREIRDFQSKAFEIADLYAKMEAVRLAIWKACWAAEKGEDFRLESSISKYLAVNTAREVTSWAADIFGGASVVFEHPIHKYPMDVWAASLGEGTQDVQKLIIFREVMKRFADVNHKAT